MKMLLTKLNTAKFCFLKYDEEEATRLWKSLLKNQMDTSISLSKLQSLLATPSKEESKSSNSGSRRHLMLTNPVPISFSKFTKSSPSNFENRLVNQSQNKLQKSMSNTRIDEMIKEKQDHYRKVSEINKIKENHMLKE